MKHYNILIATPGTNLHAAYVSSLTDSLAFLAENNLSFKWLNGQSSLVHHARELTISGGGKELSPNDKGPMGDSCTYDKIVWIDSDISWTVEDFERIIQSSFEVTTGAYLLTDGSTTIHAWHKGPMHREEINRLRDPFKIQSCGFGFIAMKSGVFERMPRPWFNHEFVKVGTDQNGKDVIDCVGEDISWCIKAYREKIDIWFDPKILVTHHKTMPLRFT
jgi:hypothetical protein